MKLFCAYSLLHLLQHLAACVGLVLNGSKRQLISIHSDFPVSLSNGVIPESPCDCPFCAPFYGLSASPSSLDLPLTPLSSAKYLGSFIAPTSSSHPDVSFRCSQASHAFKCLGPFFRHTLISPKRTLQVYSQVVQSLLLHLQPMLHVLIPLTTKHSATFSKSKTPITTVSSIPQMPDVPIVISLHWLILSNLHFPLRPSTFQTRHQVRRPHT